MTDENFQGNEDHLKSVVAYSDELELALQGNSDLDIWTSRPVVSSSSDFSNFDLKGASFQAHAASSIDYPGMIGLRLPHAKFDGSDLTQTDFGHADLSKASFRGANLREASLDNAFINGADFRGADITGATIVTHRMDESTIMPIETVFQTRFIGSGPDVSTHVSLSFGDKQIHDVNLLTGVMEIRSMQQEESSPTNNFNVAANTDGDTIAFAAVFPKLLEAGIITVDNLDPKLAEAMGYVGDFDIDSQPVLPTPGI